MKRRNKEIIKRFFRIGTFTGYLIIYVMLYLKIIYLGYKIEELKEKYERINLLNQKYQIEYTKIMSPENLERLAKEKNMNLIVPERWCVIEIEKENEKDIKNKKILEAGTK